MVGGGIANVALAGRGGMVDGEASEPGSNKTLAACRALPYESAD